MSSIHLSYRRDIDGLRAVAILSVIAFHAFPTLVRGGFVGVDIFFVISGYLISSILLRNIDRDEFSIRDFYARRAKRIFPALIIVLLFCLAAGWVFMVADEYKMLSKHVIAGAFFFSNFAFWMEAGYFDPAAELKPLLHLWSLGIEEQFYIFWPLILLILHRFKIKPIRAMLVLLVISFALNIWFVQSNPSRAFYLPDTRAWELIAGGLLACLTVRGHPLIFTWLTLRIKTLLSLVGVTLICIGLVVITRTDYFPGWWALLPVAGAFLIILAGPDAWFNRIVLSSRVLVSIGLISYPLYLWHWPLLSFANIINNGEPPLVMRSAAVSVAFILALLTYLLLEKRIRISASRFTPVRLASILIVVAAAGSVVFINGGLSGRHTSVELIAQAAGEWDFPGKLTHHPMRDFDLNTAGGDGAATLFFGDSNMEQYGPRIFQLVKNNKIDGRGAIFFTHGGCAPLPGVREPTHLYCDGFIDKFEKMAADPRVDTIVIAASWFSYFHSDSHTITADRLPLSSVAGQQESFQELQNMLTKLTGAGKRVYLVLNIPLWGNFNPKSMIKRSLVGFTLDTMPVQEESFMSVFAPINKDLRRVASVSGARVIDPLDTICPNGICQVIDADGKPIYRDVTHLRPTYVESAVKYLDSTVLAPS
jgi:peptidoglycan/LPS O-acetylase OafA/YrhL